MSIWGSTKGTNLESTIKNARGGEAEAAVRYAAMARLAGERNMQELSDSLMKLAVDELHHAALYEVMSGQISEDIFTIIKQSASSETKTAPMIYELAKALKAQGLEKAADEVEAAAKDEARHGEILEALFKKFGE